MILVSFELGTIGEDLQTYLGWAKCSDDFGGLLCRERTSRRWRRDDERPSHGGILFSNHYLSMRGTICLYWYSSSFS